MKLKSGRPPTAFRPPRGYGEKAIPDTGANALQSQTFHTLDEVRRAEEVRYAPGHIFLGRVDDQMIGVKDNRHIVTIAGSRSGKSACLLIPNLLLYPGAALVIDPKGELAEATALHRRDKLGQKVMILDPFEVVGGEAAKLRAWHDPLRELDIDGPDLIDDAAALAEALVLESPGTSDGSHWTLAARNLLMALVLFERFSGESLSAVRKALVGNPADLWDMLQASRPQGNEEPIIQEAMEIIAAQGLAFAYKNDREAPAIISTAIEQLGFLMSPAMRQLFEPHGREEARLENLKVAAGEQPTTIYLVLPSGRVGTHSRWLRLVVTSALQHFERNKAKPEYPILMILEEFAALGHLRPVEQAAGFIAGSHVRLWSVLQDLSQLKTHYKDGWETFLGNAGILQAFSVSDLTTCEYLSKKLGDTTVETSRKDSVGTSQFRGGDTGERREFKTLPLLTPSEIDIQFARISVDGEARGGPSLVLLPGSRTFVVDRVHWSELA
jgi:type IV secretion system protein VirD4